MYWLELVSKELSHLAAILHVYARGLIFWKLKNVVIIFQKEKGNTFTLLIMIIDQTPGINMQNGGQVI